MLVFEGITPFISPRGFKKMLLNVLQVSDNSLRFMGFGLMIVGTILIYVVH